MVLDTSIVGLSLLGTANMVLSFLRQLGVIRHLPDPPIKGFNSDRVTLSEKAFPLGVPDSIFVIFSLGLNIPLVLFSNFNNWNTFAYVLLVKTGIEAIIAGWYFLRMPFSEKAWCVYCILSFVIYSSVFLMVLKSFLSQGLHI